MNRLRILQVNLSEAVGGTTVEHLERRGHDVAVETVTGAAAALDYLGECRSDCVVFGADLPEIDVSTFLERVRTDYPDIPVILVTDQRDPDRLDDALAAGVTECVREADETARYTLLARRIHDAVERVRIERERNEERRFVDQLFDQVPVSLYVKDEQARHVRLSGFYGADSEAVEGKTDRELYPYVGEESYRDDMEVIRTGEPILNRVEHLPKQEMWNMTSKAPWYGDDGEINGLIGVTWRITDQKESERELQKQNERLDEFARIVSHELRNPLQIARGRTEILRESVDNDHPDEVLDALDRMGDLITNLLALARGKQHVDDESPLSLAEAATKCWQSACSETASLDIESDATIRAERGLFEHLLENLFENAIEYGSETVTVTVGPTAEADGFYVADDGPGIPESDRDEVFDVGYSTGGERVGYGLRIVAEVAATHGWEIAIESSDDGGTRFDITSVELGE